MMSTRHNTLSDVSFGEDTSVLGPLVIAGAAIGGVIVGYVIKLVRGDRKSIDKVNALEKETSELKKLVKGIIANSAAQNPQGAQANTATAPA